MKRGAPVETREPWQITQGAACGCKGGDDMCPCQNVDRSAPAPAAEPVGDWVMVPREPTHAMVCAGDGKDPGFGSLSPAIYRAMIAAAPRPPEPAISTDGPHEISKTRKWLARQLLDSMLSEKEALGVVAYSPALEGVRPPPEPVAISREEIATIIRKNVGGAMSLLPAQADVAADAILSKLSGRAS